MEKAQGAGGQGMSDPNSEDLRLAREAWGGPWCEYAGPGVVALCREPHEVCSREHEDEIRQLAAFRAEARREVEQELAKALKYGDGAAGALRRVEAALRESETALASEREACERIVAEVTSAASPNDSWSACGRAILRRLRERAKSEPNADGYHQCKDCFNRIPGRCPHCVSWVGGGAVLDGGLRERAK